MKIAYIISAYKYPELLVRLILRLNAVGVTFLIHFDRRTDNRQYCKIVHSLDHLSNVIFLERHQCYWGDMGHVNATIKGIKALVEKEIDFDYVVLLTGQDYPIQTNDKIQHFLQENDGKSFIEFFPVDLNSESDEPVSSTLWRSRLERWHVVLFGTLRPILPNRYISLPLKHHFPAGFQPFVGSSYWCLHRQCIEYIYNFIRCNKKFVSFFKFTSVSDEVFFQTILLNSYLKDSLVNDSMRFIRWTGEGWTGKPKTLEIADLEDIVLSSKLFARKVAPVESKELLDRLDKLIVLN